MKGQQIPQKRVESVVKIEARQEIASEGVNAIEVEEVIPMAVEMEVKKAPLKKKKAPGARASENKRISNINKNSKTRKEEDKKNGVVKVKKEKVVEVKEAAIPAKRKVGRPKMTHKQKFIAKIIRDGKKNDNVISAAQADVIYYSVKAANRAKSTNEVIWWFKSVKKMQDGVCKRMIILMAVAAIIKGKLGMPKNINAYKDRSIEMAAVQTANLSTYFTVAFTGLALWIGYNTALNTAIFNYGQKNGTGSTALIAAAKVKVKASLNLFMAYINALAAANQALAVSIIETALCVVIVRNPPKIVDFKYTMGPGTGNIRLKSAAVNVDGKRVPGTYEFQYGIMTEGVIVWVSLPSQKNCKILLTGMSTTVTTYFRKRSSTSKGGMSAWSAPISTTVA